MQRSPVGRPATPPDAARRVRVTLIAVVVATAINACGSADSGVEPLPDTTGPAAPALTSAVVGVQWILLEVFGGTDAGEASFSLFADGRYVVEDGTAESAGTYTLHPDGIAFSPETGPGAAMTDTASANTAEQAKDTGGTVPDGRSLMLDLQRPLTGDVSLGLSQDGLTLTISLGRTSARFRYGGPA